MPDPSASEDPERIARWRCRAKSEPNATLQLFTSPAGAELAAPIRRWLSGVACFELGDTDGALRHFDASLAEVSSLWEPHVEISRLAAVAARGSGAGVADRLQQLSHHEDPVVAALAVSQLGFDQLAAGALVDAEVLFREAIDPLRVADHFDDALARVLGNVGTSLLHQQRIIESIPFHYEALEISRPIGYRQLEAGSLQNLGFSSMRLGRFPEAIEQLAQARAVYDEMGGATRGYASLLTDLAETHRLAGLEPEAIDYAEQAVEVLRGGTDVEAQAEARVHLARCLLDGGHIGAARAEAVDAARTYGDAGRPIRQARAQLLAWEAELEVENKLSDDQLADAMLGIERVSSARWRGDAQRFAASLAYWLNEREEPVHPSLTAEPSAVGDAQDKDLLFELEDAMRRAMRSFRTRSDEFEAAIDEARAHIAAHASELHDGELRAGVSALGGQFDRLETLRCVRHSDPGRLLDGQIAASVLNHEILSESASDLWGAELLDEIRRITVEFPPGASRDERVRRLERTFSEETRAQPATERLSVLSAETVKQQLAELARTTEVVSIVRFGRRYAIVRADPNRPEIVGTADRTQVGRLGRSLRKTLQRLMVGNDRMPAAVANDVRAACADAQVLGDHLLPASQAGSALLIIAPPELLDLPWRLIAAPAGSVMLSPSLAHVEPPLLTLDTPRAAVIAGPRLDYAAADVTTMQRVFNECEVIEAENARVAPALHELVHCDLVHMAAHGFHRHDSPRFSSFELSDGPLMLHDLTRQRSAAHLVFLAACDAARSGSATNAAGTAGRLLEAGVGAVIAPTSSVPDRESSVLAEAFYGHLASTGDETTAAGALAAATPHPDSGADPALWAAAHSFAIFGGSDVSVSLAPLDPLQKRDAIER